MSRCIALKKTGYVGLLLVSTMVSAILAAAAAPAEVPPIFSPAVNVEGLRGLTSVGSAETMGAGRITFSLSLPWYRQERGYLNTPNTGANVFVGTGAFTFGVNNYVDIFTSISVYGISNYTGSDEKGGLGTIRAGAQGSLPFPKAAFIRIGGQIALIGGTSSSQINSYRADGYNYLETRTGFDITAKLMQTIRFGGEDFGIRLHLNEGGVVGLVDGEPALLLLSGGLQANLAFAVLGVEINSRTRASDLAFATDPLWVTPSVHLRTPWNVNATIGVDIALSEARTVFESGVLDNPRALEPYRVFGALAVSVDVFKRRKAELAAKRLKEAQDREALEQRADRSADRVETLTEKAIADSVALAEQRRSGSMQRDSMQQSADSAALASQAAAAEQAKRATADSLALVQAAADLAAEKEKRSDAENKLLSTGELLLDAVFFESGKTVISINSKPYLNVIIVMLQKYPNLQIEVAGHTDNIGAPAYNESLSLKRAEAVRDYMVYVEPTLRDRLSARGYGITMPKADNTTKDGRLANRRVELRVINKDELQKYN